MQEDLKSGPGIFFPDDEETAPVNVYLVPPKKKSYPLRWLLLWQDPSEIGVSMSEQAEMERPLTQTEYRVRDWILGTIGIGNYCYINQAEIARRLRVHRQNVYQAIQRLLELGILIKGPKNGRCNSYMVSPAFCFFGSLGAGAQARKAEIQEKAKVIPFRTS